MTALWQSSLVPMIGINGRPMVGAKAYFFDASTTTPQTVWAESGLGVSLDRPVVTNARGMFPAVFLNPDPGVYRVLVTDADDAVIYDVDNISVPQDANFEPPDTGDTSETLLFKTGMRIGFYGSTNAPAGWVRCNGRTLGRATSGATERANDDAEALFLHLWGVDTTLAVSGGRGGSASGDWGSGKTIALPDYRERVPAGLATMGADAAGRISSALLDGGETSSTLGATGGADDVALISGQLPAHTHTGSGTTGNDSPDHAHSINAGAFRGLNGSGNRGWSSGDSSDGSANLGSGGASARHAHSFSFTTSSVGDGDAHTNLQPTTFELVIIKL